MTAKRGKKEIDAGQNLHEVASKLEEPSWQTNASSVSLLDKKTDVLGSKEEEETDRKLKDTISGKEKGEDASIILSDMDRKKMAKSSNENSTCKAHWSALLNLGAAASGLSIALSHDSMKSLKYCISWLQYAIAHIEHHVNDLQDFMDALRKDGSSLTPAAMQKLANTQKEITELIRTIIDVASKYVDNALPEYARRIVKNCLLSLPERWRNASLKLADASQSPSKQHVQTPSGANEDDMQIQKYCHPSVEVTAAKLLTLGVESLKIMKRMMQVLVEVMDHADSWVERLGSMLPQSTASSSTPSRPHGSKHGASDTDSLEEHDQKRMRKDDWNEHESLSPKRPSDSLPKKE